MPTTYPNTMDIFTNKIDNFHDVMAADVNNLQDAIKAIESLLGAPPLGWYALPFTPTYASSVTFTVAGDVTAHFPVGSKIRLTQTSDKYFYVVSAVYSAPNTTVTVDGRGLYTLANATITEPKISYQHRPAGFPFVEDLPYFVTQLSELTLPDPADLATVLEDPAGSPVAKKIRLDKLVATLFDGWMLYPATWTYASAATFTVAGDVTAMFPVGAKVKLTQTSDKYFYVVSAVYSAPNTTVTVDGRGLYTLANAAITNPRVSYAEHPAGFPLVDDGWIPQLETWTYASATTFTVPGDLTHRFRRGTKVKLTQTTDKYFYVLSSSYSSPNTTVTVCGGDTYSLANAAITNPKVSYLETPQGFPWTGGWIDLNTPLTSTTFDGDLFSTTSKTKIDLSEAYGVPPGVRAVMVAGAVRDSGSVNSDCYMLLDPSDTADKGAVPIDAPRSGNNHFRRFGGLICTCDAGGDIYYQIKASGSSTFKVYLEIIGYQI